MRESTWYRLAETLFLLGVGMWAGVLMIGPTWADVQVVAFVAGGCWLLAVCAQTAGLRRAYRERHRP